MLIATVLAAMARRELSSEIEINATPELLWQILTDFGSYPEWNPFIVEISGTPVRNAKIRVCVVPRGTKIQFRPRVLAVEANRELRWLGRVWFPGLLDGGRVRMETLNQAMPIGPQGRG